MSGTLKSVTCINLFNPQLALWVCVYGRMVTFLSLLHLIDHIILKTTLQSSIITPILQVKQLSLKVIESCSSSNMPLNQYVSYLSLLFHLLISFYFPITKY